MTEKAQGQSPSPRIPPEIPSSPQDFDDFDPFVLKDRLISTIQHLNVDLEPFEPIHPSHVFEPVQEESEDLVSNIDRVFSEPLLLGECDEYCTYIKEIEDDSNELEQHLKDLKLVDEKDSGKKLKKFADDEYVQEFLRQNQVPAFRFKKYDPSSSTSDSGSNDSSLADINLKTTGRDSDEEALIPRTKKALQEVAEFLNELKEHSKSLDDLTRKKPESGLIDTDDEFKEVAGSIARLRIDGEPIECISRSVLDLTKVGLKEDTGSTPSTPVDPIEHNKRDIFLDRRCSEVFGQRADLTPFYDPELEQLLKSSGFTQSLQYLDNRLTIDRTYDTPQSTECLYHVEKPKTSRANEGAIPKSKFRVYERPLIDPKVPKPVTINRVYVKTPRHEEFRDLNKPKKLKSILKRTGNLQASFESSSLSSLNDQQDQSHMRLAQSWSEVSKEPKPRSKREKTPDPFSSKGVPNFSQFVIPSTSPLSRNRSVSSNSLTDISYEVVDHAHPPASLITYFTPSHTSSSSSQRSRPYVDYFDWSKVDGGEEEINLSETDCTKIISSDSEFTADDSHFSSKPQKKRSF